MNWKHSLYDIYCLSFGQSYTYSEAHRILSELKQDRLFSLATVRAEGKRSQGKILDHKNQLNDLAKKSELSNPERADQRRSEAAVLETDARYAITRPSIKMCLLELSFIDKCLSFIDPSMLLHPTPAVAYQIAQPLEYAMQYIDSTMLRDVQVFDLERNIRINPYRDSITSALTNPGDQTNSPFDKFIDIVSERYSNIGNCHFIKQGTEVEMWNRLQDTVTDLALDYDQALSDNTVKLLELVNEATGQLLLKGYTQ
jgi:hypothetical protein